MMPSMPMTNVSRMIRNYTKENARFAFHYRAFPRLLSQPGAVDDFVVDD